MGSDESHFNVSVGSDGQSHKTVSTNHNLFWRERRAEVESNQGPSTYQPNAILLGQTSSPILVQACLDINPHCGWRTGAEGEKPELHPPHPREARAPSPHPREARAPSPHPREARAPPPHPREARAPPPHPREARAPHTPIQEKPELHHPHPREARAPPPHPREARAPHPPPFREKPELHPSPIPPAPQILF